MSLHTNQLGTYYQTEVVSARRTADGIWDFLQKENDKAKPWIDTTIRMIRDDLGDMLEEDYHHFLNELEASSITPFHYALWFSCVNLYPGMKTFLMTSDDFQRPNDNMLAIFLEQDLPAMFQKWKDGNYSSTKNWVRHLIATYVVTVPCLVQPQQQQKNLLLSDTS